jgi:probable rRNA maturation factor
MRLIRPPSVTIRNLQRRVFVSTRKVELFARTACQLAWQARRPSSEITRLTHVEVSIVSNRRMATLHKKFCGIPGPTDVLTFQHGEIVVSADMAVTQARNFHTHVIAEIQLYLLHGLLHLAGFDDTDSRQRKQMLRLQGRLFSLARRSDP